MKSGLTLCISLLHLWLLFATNVCSLLHTHAEIDPEQRRDGLRQAALHLLEKILTMPPLEIYSRLSGAEGTYGFFSPQVASTYVLRVTCHYSDRPADTITDLGLQQHESGVRAIGLLQHFSSLLPAVHPAGTSDPAEQHRSRALAYQLAQRIAQTRSAIAAEVQVCVYVQPGRREYLEGARLKLAQLYRQKIHMQANL
jgi:hypothetical protein